MEYASNGKGNLGVTLGAIGTGLAALGGTGILGNLAPANNGARYVTDDVFAVQLDLIDEKKKSAILQADLNTETKIVDAFKASVDRENKIRDELKNEIRNVEAKVDANAASQAVINAQFSNQISLNTSQIAQLFGMTKLVIPNTSVCPGWGTATVSIAPSGTTTT